MPASGVAGSRVEAVASFLFSLSSVFGPKWPLCSRRNGPGLVAVLDLDPKGRERVLLP